ncbi:hypothetical protein ATO4_12101 [Aurantimonas sp. 22II-16-19i]|nr:hypothetical protein ATO4_12101 [Aurantimonas sp. 22II-16-19i]
MWSGGLSRRSRGIGRFAGRGIRAETDRPAPRRLRWTRRAGSSRHQAFRHQAFRHQPFFGVAFSLAFRDVATASTRGGTSPAM